jgi:hypothetical protein
MDPTSAGDMRAELMRWWYEKNRETWWDRHRLSADRKGIHADEWMLGLMNEASRIDNLSDNELCKEDE